MMKPSRLHIEHIIVFVVVFGITSYSLSEVLDMKITDMLWLFILLQALIFTGFFFAFRKKHVKAGHLPLIIGLYLLVLGGGMFAGSIEHDKTNQYGDTIKVEKLWDLSQRNAGIFIFALIVGIVLVGIGLRIAMQNAYFWTWKAWVVILVTVGIIALVVWSFLNQ